MIQDVKSINISSKFAKLKEVGAVFVYIKFVFVLLYIFKKFKRSCKQNVGEIVSIAFSIKTVCVRLFAIQSHSESARVWVSPCFPSSGCFSQQTKFSKIKVELANNWVCLFIWHLEPILPNFYYYYPHYSRC